MVRSTVRKVMWVGRATVFVVGLSVILALMFGAASAAFGADGKPFILGERNVAQSLSTLVKQGKGPALSLDVGANQPPLKVDSSKKVAMLNADLVDGKNSSSFAPLSGFDAAKVIDTAGPLPRQGTYTSKGGTLIISVAGSGFRASGNAQRHGNIGMRVTLDGNDVGYATVYTNERDSHKVFVNDYIVLADVPAGAHTIGLEALYNYPLNHCNSADERDWHYCTTTDSNDVFKVTVVELPD